MRPRLAYELSPDADGDCLDATTNSDNFLVDSEADERHHGRGLNFDAVLDPFWI